MISWCAFVFAMSHICTEWMFTLKFPERHGTSCSEQVKPEISVISTVFEHSQIFSQIQLNIQYTAKYTIQISYHKVAQSPKRFD